jgi:hypothetical protein
MVINEPVAELQGAATCRGAPPSTGLRNTLGRLGGTRSSHDRRGRRRFVVSASVIAIVGAIAFAFLA